MQVIIDPGGLRRVSHHGIAHVLSQRLSELQLSRKEVLSDIGCFIVVEANDTINALEKASACHITTDLFGEADYGDPDFVPSFEWVEHHISEGCFEVVFITNDDGHFTVFLIPGDPSIDADLLSFCREYS